MAHSVAHIHTSRPQTVEERSLVQSVSSVSYQNKRSFTTRAAHPQPCTTACCSPVYIIVHAVDSLGFSGFLLACEAALGRVPGPSRSDLFYLLALWPWPRPALCGQSQVLLLLPSNEQDIVLSDPLFMVPEDALQRDSFAKRHG